MTDIRDLQRRLLSLGHEPGPVDGVIGALTTAAIMEFQEENGLVVDGIAGPQTLAALRAATEPAKTGRPEPDKSVMALGMPDSQQAGAVNIRLPPNVGALLLLDTARPISELIWHCAATREGQHFDMDDITAWHQQRGWRDNGYHYGVLLDGTIELGRPVGQVGAHVEGRNSGAIGCVYIGGVASDGRTPKDTRTPAQRSSMLWLTRELRRRHKGIKAVKGHNDYTNAKACPSFKVGQDALGKMV